MNKVEQELQGASDCEPKKGEDRVDYLVRLMKATAALSEKEWDKLSPEAQAWYNTNADKRNAAKKAGKDIPDPADFEAEEEEPKGRKTKAAEKDTEKGADKGEATAVEKLEEGQRVKIITTRDKEIAGEVVENSKRKEFVVIKDAEGEEHELDYAKVESVEVFHGTAGTKDEQGGGDTEPAVGDEVEITTKRGKTIKCTITAMDDDSIEFEDKDGKDDIGRERVESIKVVKKAKAGAKPAKAAAKEEEPAGRRSSKTDDGEKGGKDDEPEKRTRTTNEGGVSVGLRIKELVAENLDATEEEIVKMLTKEKLAFKENTVHLNYVECHKFVDILKARKLLKTGK